MQLKNHSDEPATIRVDVTDEKPDGKPVKVMPGKTVDVEPEKAAILLRDYPQIFEAA